MCGWIIGILAGLAIGSFIQRRRAWRHRRGPWGLLRVLELDGGQRDELKQLFFGLKRSARGLRQEDDFRRVMEVLAQPSFDRGKVEAASAEKAAAFERLRAEFISALEKAHAVLKPEQRARLADWFQIGFAPSAGPYR